MTLISTAAGSSSSASGALTLLSTTTLAAPGTIDVSGIASTYNDLVLVLIARGVAGTANDGPFLRLNNDAGASQYFREGISVSGTAAVSGFETLGTSALSIGVMPGSTGLANSFGASVTEIFGYASTTWLKTIQWSSWAMFANATTNLSMHRGGGLWNSTAVVNRVTILNNAFGNLATGSQLRIYGRL